MCIVSMLYCVITTNVIMDKNIFCVGLLYTYLAGHVGRKGDEGAFRALARGYNHWASGRLEQLEVNVNHPEYCHVRCSMKASMNSSTYHVYLLLG